MIWPSPRSPAPAAASRTRLRVEAFRSACARFATGVAIVTAVEDGIDYGLTVNAFASLSLDPMQVIVCVAHTSNTCNPLLRTGAFAINLLSSEQARLARRFATKLADKMSAVETRRGLLGPALIDGAHAVLECRLDDAIPRRSHVICIADVISVMVDDSRAPLVFYRSRLHGGVGRPVEPLK